MCFALQNQKKFWVFFLKSDIISKLHILKLKVLLSAMVAIVVTMLLWEKVNVMYGGLKMLETIISEVTFTEFSIWFFFHEQSRFTEQRGSREAISLTPRNHFHRFTNTQTLACRLPQKAHLYIQLSAGLKSGTIGF